MKNLNFFHNWNNKLDCDCYTTIRLHNYYSEGNKVRVNLNKKEHHIAVVQGVKETKLSKLGEFVCHLDTGMNKEDTENLFRKMYKNKNIDWETQPVYVYLLRKEK